MTRKFKKAVKGVVLDGIISPEEKKLLKKVATEEKIQDTDAEIFIAKELKKRKLKLSKGPNWFVRNSEVLLTTGTALGGFIFKNFIEGKLKNRK